MKRNSSTLRLLVALRDKTVSAQCCVGTIAQRFLLECSVVAQCESKTFDSSLLVLIYSGVCIVMRFFVHVCFFRITSTWQRWF